MDTTNPPRPYRLHVPLTKEEEAQVRRLAVASRRSIASLVRDLLARAAAQEVARG